MIGHIQLNELTQQAGIKGIPLENPHIAKLEKLLVNLPKHYRIRLVDKIFDVHHSASVLPKTALRELKKRPWLDAWVSCNPLKAAATPVGVARKTGQTIYRTEFKNDNSCNEFAWRLDLDHMSFDNSEGLLAFLNEKGISIEGLKHAIRTSKNCFHLVFTGENGYWNPEKRLELLNKISGLNTKKRAGFPSVTEASGVDYAASMSFEEYRIPYTYHSESRDFITVFGLNINKNKPLLKIEEKTVLKIVPVQKAEQQTQEVEKVQEKLPVNPNIHFIAQQLSSFFDSRSDEKILDFVRLLAAKAVFLVNGSHALSQDGIAKILGTEQKNVSNWLKSLIKKGVLCVVEDYVPPTAGKKGKARVYQWSADFVRNIQHLIPQGKASFVGKKRLENGQYAVGESWAGMMKDARACRSAGMTQEEAVEFIEKRAERRSLKDVQRIVDWTFNTLKMLVKWVFEPKATVNVIENYKHPAPLTWDSKITTIWELVA